MQFLIALSAALPQQSPADEILHFYSPMPFNRSAHLEARGIQREAPGLQWSPSIIHLKGDVAIRISVAEALKVRPESGKKPSHTYMILRADQADYHESTGEIEARGNVRVTFEPTE